MREVKQRLGERERGETAVKEEEEEEDQRACKTEASRQGRRWSEEI